MSCLTILFYLFEKYPKFFFVEILNWFLWLQLIRCKLLLKGGSCFLFAWKLSILVFGSKPVKDHFLCDSLISDLTRIWFKRWSCIDLCLIIKSCFWFYRIFCWIKMLIVREGNMLVISIKEIWLYYYSYLNVGYEMHLIISMYFSILWI